MKRNSDPAGYLYLNGKHNGASHPHERLAGWWWQQAGLELQHAHINWYEDGLDAKIDEVELQSRELLHRFGRVAIIGSSAGVSLALNTFHERLRNDNVCLILAHGRVRAGNYLATHRNSLQLRAGIGSVRPAPAFERSVLRVEQEVLPNLTGWDKQRMLQLTQLTDMVAPLETCYIDGVRLHRSLAFGHTGGFAAHLLAGRDFIVKFATEVLE